MSLLLRSLVGIFLLVACVASAVSEAELPAQTALPLTGHTQDLSFTTTEGSWLSVDVSPDGNTVFFDLLGDIYSLPVDGGEAVSVTQGLGFDSQPTISPDGEWLAFISDRDGADNLWIMRADGSELQKLSDEQQWALISPSWSPDGKFVLVTRHGIEKELVYYHVDGGSGVSLAAADSDAEAPWGMGASISPDGRYVYSAIAADSTRPVDGFPSAQIGRFDLRSGEMVQLTQGIGGGLRPVLSPDGKLLVYGTRSDSKTALRVRDLQTGNDRLLIKEVQRDGQENYSPQSRDLLPGYGFTPDGKALILNVHNKLWRVDVASGRQRELPFTVAVKLQVGPDLTAAYRLEDTAFDATIVHSPALAPDGRQFAASVLGKLFVMRNDENAQPQRLETADVSAFKPVWSPDGQWLSFVSWSDLEGGHIWRIAADGGRDPERLTEYAAFYTDLAYAPDGSQLYALRGNAFQRQQTFSEFGGLRIPLELVSLPATGGELHALGSSESARGLHFGPEADRVYLSDESGLFSLSLVGKDRRDEMKVNAPRGNGRGEESPTAESMRVSPDGLHVLVFSGKQLWLLPRRPVGGAALTVDLRAPALPVLQLTDTGADFYGWSADGTSIWWSIGHTLFQRDLTSMSFTVAMEAQAADLADEASALQVGTAREDRAETRKLSFEVELARDRASGHLLLRNFQLLAMSGSSTAAMAELEGDREILISDGRIAAIGPHGSIDVPAGAHEMDLGGRYLMPGFIDTHAHWEFRTDDVLEPHTWSLAANLAYGVTTGLDVQTFTPDYFAYRDLVASGQSVGQRALMTGPGIFGGTDFQSYAAVYHYLRRYSDHYRSHNIKSYMVGNRQQRQWIVLASKALGLMPTTEGAGDQRLDLTHAIDGMHGNEHTLPDFPLGKDVVELFARTRTAYTPTLIVQYNAESMREYFFTREDIHDDPKLRRFYPANRLDELTERRPGWQRDEEFVFQQAAADAAKVQRAGGLVGVGGHAELQGLGYHWEMWAFALGGMRPAEILRAATIDGARIVGVADDLGSVEPGKLADLVVLERNPLEDIRNTTSIHRVIQNGRVYDGRTLDTLWPEPKAFPPFWWWAEAPETAADTSPQR